MARAINLCYTAPSMPYPDIKFIPLCFWGRCVTSHNTVVLEWVRSDIIVWKFYILILKFEKYNEKFSMYSVMNTTPYLP